MGMCLGLNSVSDENIKRIMATPALIWLLLAPDDPEMYQEAVQQANQSGFISKIFGKKQKSELLEIPALEFVEG